MSSVAIGLVLAGIICVLAPKVAPPSDTAAAGAACDLHDHGGAAPAGGEEHADHDHADHEHGDDDHAVHEPDGADPGLQKHDHSHEHDTFATPLFHLFHPVHMFFSAAATTAMFWRYERRVIKAIIIGILGAVGVCGVSDIIMPFCSQYLLIESGVLQMSGKLHFHICIIDHPGLVLPFAAIGVVVGIGAAMAVERSTLFSHSLHVFSSTMASIFYLIGPFGRTAWIDGMGFVFVLIVLAVMLPCCVSDIVFPLAFTSRGRERFRHAHPGGHHH